MFYFFNILGLFGHSYLDHNRYTNTYRYGKMSKHKNKLQTKSFGPFFQEIWSKTTRKQVCYAMKYLETLFSLHMTLILKLEKIEFLPCAYDDD
jgi:hypothetical protein